MGTTKRSDAHVMGILEEWGEKEIKNIFGKIKMAENFPSMMKNMNLHIQAAQQTPSIITTKRSTPRHIIV